MSEQIAYTVIESREASKVRKVADVNASVQQEWAAAVRQGRMVFVPAEGKVSFAARLGRWPKANGVRVRQRKDVRDGVVGYYVWTEALA